MMTDIETQISPEETGKRGGRDYQNGLKAASVFLPEKVLVAIKKLVGDGAGANPSEYIRNAVYNAILRDFEIRKWTW